MEEQNTNSTDVCVKCGTPFGEGQDFCPKCGTPKGGPEKKLCGKCGAELADGQEYCPKCGQKVVLAFDKPVSSSTDRLNAGNGEKKKNNNIKIIIAIAIPVVLIAVGLLVFSLLSGSVKGKYVSASQLLASNASSISYNFEGDSFSYNSGDDTKQGTYKVEKDKVTLSVSGKDDTILYHDGKYLFDSDQHFDEKIQNGKTINQTLTCSSSTNYKGYTLALNIDLALKSDGTYTVASYMTYDGASVGDDITNESGTYKRSGNKLILSPQGKNFTKTLIIKDGIVYYVVYMKEK